MKNFIQQLLASLLLMTMTLPAYSSAVLDPAEPESGFLGMWTINIEGGGVGWLHVHEEQGYLDAALLWIGGSVLPVSHVYRVDDNHLVVTRTQSIEKSKNKEGAVRTHTLTYRLDVRKVGDHIFGTMTGPNRNGTGENISSFVGKRLPPVGAAPDLSAVTYGKSISLFNGRNLEGWKLTDPERKNGFKAVQGALVNDPRQEEGHHVNYGNLRTEREFEDFNLKLEVNVPAGNNSGIYLRGMYEIQVFDSYEKELDSHNMGAVYSRIKPTMAAEKPGGTWQSFDITLCDRHITVILNGKKIIDNQPVYGPTGGALLSDVFAPGPIYLQGDHGNVSYRNFELREIIK